MNLADIRMVLFDLDGTLVDSVPDIAHGVDGMMVELGFEAPGEAKVRGWVGNGVEKLVKRALTGGLEDEPAGELFDRGLPSFMAHYSRCNGSRSRLYPGVADTLDRLAGLGITLACVTNKSSRFTAPLLESLKIADHFALVISGDSLPEKKPSPLPLLHAAGSFGLEPGKCLMVGDSENDVRAARAAGFPVVAVSYGYNYGRDIRLAEPDLVIDDFSELATLLS